MLAVLSPAKSLDLDSAVPPVDTTWPRFAADAAMLAKAAAKLRPKALGKLMHISPALAELNAGRFHDFDPAADPAGARPALYTFDGDVYMGLRGPDMDAATRDFAQDHVRILSGLYGILRPLDRIQPYRLEMGTNFGVGRKKTLYAVWGDRLAAALADDLAGHDDRTLVNLASEGIFHRRRPSAASPAACWRSTFATITTASCASTPSSRRRRAGAWRGSCATSGWIDPTG